MSEFLSEEQLLEMEIRCNQASPAPWKSYFEGRYHTSGSNFIMTGTSNGRGPDIELTGGTVKDQDFIASAREDVPRLIKEVRTLQALLVNQRGKAQS